MKRRMCGRYAITTVPEAMRRMFRYPEQPNFPPRYNVAPTQPVPVVHMGEQGGPHFTLMRWGLLPAWVKDPKRFTLLINARGETVNEKPAFRNAMRRRRGLMPADGFYEWKRDGVRKRPYYIRPKDGGPMAFAALWETWIGPGGEELDTTTIITTQANDALKDLHDRMPVILPPDAFDIWLDERTDLKTATSLLVPAPDDQLEMFEVSDAVNRVANDDPRNIEPAITSPDSQPDAPRKPRAGRASRPDDGQGSLF